MKQISYFIKQVMVKTVLLLLLFFTSNAFAQNNNGGGGSSSIELCHQSYKVVKTDKYEFAPAEYNTLAPFDKWRYRTMTKTNIESYDFDASGEMVYSIQHIDDANIYQDWMNKPALTVFSSAGLLLQRQNPGIYGTNQTLLPLSESQKMMFDVLSDQTRQFKNRIIIPPTEDELVNSGEWTEDEDGNYVKNDGDGGSGVTFITPDGKMYISTVDPSCNCKTLDIYERNIADADILTLSYEQTVCNDVLPDGTPFKRVTKMDYSEWEVEACNNQPIVLNEMEPDGFGPYFKLYPNPATDELFIEIPKGIEVQSVDVVDRLGRLMQVKDYTSEGKVYIQLDKGMDNGLYYVRIQHKTGEKMLKFIMNK